MLFIKLYNFNYSNTRGLNFLLDVFVIVSLLYMESLSYEACQKALLLVALQPTLPIDQCGQCIEPTHLHCNSDIYVSG